MSVKNFYQTLYQNEQLFRLDETMFPVMRQDESTASVMLEPEAATDQEAMLVIEPVTVSAPAITEVRTLTIEDVPVVKPEPVQPTPVAKAPVAEAPKPIVEAVEPVTEPVKSAVPVAPLPTAPAINHKVLILADEALTASDLLFLEKILKAVNLNLDGVELLNLHGAGHIDFADVLRGKFIHHFITFGVPFRRIGLDIMMDRYQPVRFEGISFLMADSLPTVEADQNLKRALWNSLKRVFTL